MIYGGITLILKHGLILNHLTTSFYIHLTLHAHLLDIHMRLLIFN